MDIFNILLSSTPKAKRTPLELDFIIAIALALAAFYFASRAMEKFFPNADAEIKKVVVIVATVGVLALVMFLFNL